MPMGFAREAPDFVANRNHLPYVFALDSPQPASGGKLQKQLTNKLPGASVITNELIEAAKGSDTLKKIQSELNQGFGEQK